MATTLTITNLQGYSLTLELEETLVLGPFATETGLPPESAEYRDWRQAVRSGLVEVTVVEDP